MVLEKGNLTMPVTAPLKSVKITPPEVTDDLSLLAQNGWSGNGGGERKWIKGDVGE